MEELALPLPGKNNCHVGGAPRWFSGQCQEGEEARECHSLKASPWSGALETEKVSSGFLDCHSASASRRALAHWCPGITAQTKPTVKLNVFTPRSGKFLCAIIFVSQGRGV